MMEQHQTLQRTHKHPHVYRPAGLPDDAVVGHNPDMVKLLQAYQDQNNPDKIVVDGYAVSPNPSVEGDYVGDGNRQILFYWFKHDRDTISMTSADYAFNRLIHNKTTWAD